MEMIFHPLIPHESIYSYFEKVKSTKVVQSQQPTDLYPFMITLISLNNKL